MVAAVSLSACGDTGTTTPAPTEPVATTTGSSAPTRPPGVTFATVPATTAAVAVTAEPPGPPHDQRIWELDGLTVTMTPRARLQPDPDSPGVSDTDVANGLFALEWWRVNGSLVGATLSVQTDPGDDGPVNAEPYDETVTSAAAEWVLRTSEELDPRPALVLAFARHSGCLIHVSGTRDVVDEIINALALVVEEPA